MNQSIHTSYCSQLWYSAQQSTVRIEYLAPSFLDADLLFVFEVNNQLGSAGQSPLGTTSVLRQQNRWEGNRNAIETKKINQNDCSPVWIVRLALEIFHCRFPRRPTSRFLGHTQTYFWQSRWRFPGPGPGLDFDLLFPPFFPGGKRRQRKDASPSRNDLRFPAIIHNSIHLIFFSISKNNQTGHRRRIFHIVIDPVFSFSFLFFLRKS